MPRLTSLSKHDLLRRIATEHLHLRDLVEKCSPDAVIENGGWELKDILAHISAWEWLTLARLEAARTGKAPDIPPVGTETEIDRVNARILEQARNRSFEEVQEDFTASHTALVAAIEACADQFLQAPLPEGWGRGRKVWEMLAANTIWHYPEHAEALEAWLKQNS